MDLVGRGRKDPDLVLQLVLGNQGVQDHQLFLGDQEIQSCQVFQWNLDDPWGL